MTAKIDLLGKSFGNLHCFKEVGRTEKKKFLWWFRCDCGVEFIGTTDVTKRTFLCCDKCRGERRKQAPRKHDHLGNWKSAYESWRAMKERCYNPNNKRYNVYGAVGICVCPAWFDPETGFESFFKDMGERPQGKTLDRIDVHGDYCKENCRWADATTQAYNTKRKCSNPTGRMGIYFSTRYGKERYIAYIRYQNKQIHLGTYTTLEEASVAREKAELEYYGVTKGD